VSINFEKVYKNNMDYIHQTMNGLYQDIEKADISEYELIETNGQLNVSINGNILYPDNVQASIENQVSTFLKEPTSFFKKPTRNFDEGFDYVHDKFIMEIEDASPYIQEKRIFSNYHHNIDNLFPYLIIFGIGIGRHIELLVKNADIKNLIIMDEDYSFLKISMHLIDWRPILKYFSRDGYELSFTISKKAELLSRTAINTLFQRFPYLQYYVPYFLHYNSNFFDGIKKDYLNKISLGFTGLGFYDDELLSLTHTIENINNNRAIFLNNKPIPKESNAFIIGTGPSIDDDIEYIKKHQNEAVIFSCGTALKVLEANGIVPDYHMESERPPRMYEYIANNVSKEFLKKVDFIGLNVIYPKVLTLFKSAKILFRAHDCGSSISIDSIPKLDHCNPTVVNAALSFTSELGFSNIYLFGTDMGYKDPTHHHSKYSAYNDKESSISKLKPNTINKKFQGNFDKEEEFLSSEILEWCKQRAENCINDYLLLKRKSINYVNCSDGLYIQNTIPMRSSTIGFKNQIPKKELVAILEENFDHNFIALHNALKNNFEKEKKAYLSKVNTIIDLVQSNPITSYSHLIDIFDKVFCIATDYNLMVEDKDKNSFIRSLLRGTTYHFFSSIYTHSLAMSDKELSFDYINESMKKYVSFLQYTQEDIKGQNID